MGNDMRKLVISHGTVEEDIDGESEKTPVPSHSKFMQAKADKLEQSLPIRAYHKNLGIQSRPLTASNHKNGDSSSEFERDNSPDLEFDVKILKQNKGALRRQTEARP